MAAARRKKGPGVPGEEHTLAERLRWAIDRQPHAGRQRGLRLFQRRMADRADGARKHGRAVVGTHLSTVQTYLNGTATPGVEFLNEAAIVLGVRPAWLFAGEGHPTDEEERAASDAQAAAASAMKSVAKVFRTARSYGEKELARAFPSFGLLPHYVRGEVLRTFWTFALYRAGRPGFVEREDELTPAEGWGELGGRFGAFLSGSLEFLAVEPEGIGPEQWALLMGDLLHSITIAVEFDRYREDPGTERGHDEQA